jgi:hypothetical protein
MDDSLASGVERARREVGKCNNRDDKQRFKQGWKKICEGLEWEGRRWVWWWVG